jgi:hypothetical protein
MIHEKIENILPDVFNKSIIKSTKSWNGWSQDSTVDIKSGETYSEFDTGWSIRTFSERMDSVNDFRMFTLGVLLLDTIMQKSGKTYIDYRLDRIYVNSYNKSSYCPMHVDGDNYSYDRNICSCIYFLDSSKGSYTEILGTKFYSQSGSCIIFDSNDLHSASGAIEDKERHTINLMFSYTGTTNAKA